MNYQKITSPSNHRIKEALDIKNKRAKYRQTAFLIEGPHLVEMALSSGIGIKKVFFTRTFCKKREAQKLLRKVSKCSREIFEVTENIINKLADTETPQGIVSVVSCGTLSLDELSFQKNPLLVVIDGIQDPGNLGTIIRTSDAAGVDGIILLPGTCDAFISKTIRATAGSIFNVPIVFSDNDSLNRWFNKRNLQLIATSAEEDKSVFDADLTRPTAIILGNEAHGVSRQLKHSADLILKIPIYGRAESLNVATSAAVCLYEAVRQRRSKKP